MDKSKVKDSKRCVKQIPKEASMAILIVDKLGYLTRCFKANTWGHFINIKVPVKTRRHGSPKYLNSRKNKNYIRS